ncbi:MAG: hypothetical protein WBK19_13890 [Azonexus sp.]
MSPARLIIHLLLALAVTPSFAQESPLGRLFLDPQQRARLDAQRQHNPGFQPNSGDNEASQTINGEVRSSNGRRTRWINGEADWEGTTPPPRVPVGDTFNPATGERESVIGSGRIDIKRGGSTK